MRLLAALVLLVLGVGTGLASVALHEFWWGLLLGVVATLATLVWLPPGWWSRLPFALGWAGVVGYTDDLLPYAGELPGRPDLYVAGGYSGHGNVPGFMCGRDIADAIAGRAPEPLFRV